MVEYKNIDNFIREHKHIDYCEAIIDRCGNISYATPSHVEVLIGATGMTRDEVYSAMGILDSPIEWLANKTGYICVWTKGYMLPRIKEITEEQVETLLKLIENKLVSNIFF